MEPIIPPSRYTTTPAWIYGPRLDGRCATPLSIMPGNTESNRRASSLYALSSRRKDTCESTESICDDTGLEQHDFSGPSARTIKWVGYSVHIMGYVVPFDRGRKTVFCDRLCPVRQCALSKCFETCGACKEKNTCPKVGTIWQHNPQSKNNLESI